MIDKIRCPICGYDVEPYDICENCELQNSNGTDSDKVKGANKITLSEVKQVYGKAKYKYSPC